MTVNHFNRTFVRSHVLEVIIQHIFIRTFTGKCKISIFIRLQRPCIGSHFQDFLLLYLNAAIQRTVHGRVRHNQFQVFCSVNKAMPGCFKYITVTVFYVGRTRQDNIIPQCVLFLCFRNCKPELLHFSWLQCAVPRQRGSGLARCRFLQQQAK